MNVEVALTFERLVASQMEAVVWLFTSMTSVMGLQIAFLVESFRASLKCAGKVTDAFVFIDMSL